MRAATTTLAVTATMAEAQKKVPWKMQSAWGASVPHLGADALGFCDKVGAMTGDRFKMKFFERGALVPALECFDAVSKGAVESCYTTPG